MNKCYRIFFVGIFLSYKFGLHYISVKVTINEIFMKNHYLPPLTSHKNFIYKWEVSTIYLKPQYTLNLICTKIQLSANFYEAIVFIPWTKLPMGCYGTGGVGQESEMGHLPEKLKNIYFFQKC